MKPEDAAELLGGEAYPDGEQWRCPVIGCGFTCDDDGPDRCPHDDYPLRRTMLRVPLHGGER